MAHKKAGSSSKNGRDSVGQRLGEEREAAPVAGPDLEYVAQPL